MERRIILWVVTLLWATMIFSFSAQPADGSSKMSQSITEMVLDTIPEIQSMPEEEKEMFIDECEHILRKIAHFSLYLVLGILVFGLIQSYHISMCYAICLAFLLCLLYAAGDELHQRYVPGRSAEFLDIGIDGAGSALGIASYYFANKLSHRKG